MEFITQTWNLIFYYPVVNVLLFLYKEFLNLGLSVIVLTIIIRIILIPFMHSQVKSQKKMSALKPKLDELKKAYGHDKQKHWQEQQKLYKEHGANPAGSCFASLVQLPIVIALYASIRTIAQAKNASTFNHIAYFSFIKLPATMTFNIHFLGLDIAKYASVFKFTDPTIIGYIIIAGLVGLTQFYSTKLIMGKVPLQPEEPEKPNRNEKKKKKEEPKSKEKQPEDFAQLMSTETLYFLPLMLFVMSLGYLGPIPLAVSLYWLVQNLFVIGQILVTDYIDKLKLAKYSL